MYDAATNVRRAPEHLLRSHQWIADYGAHVGGSVYLDMPEMGVVGEAQVLAIEPCPPLESGEGRLVTATFRHDGGTAYDLKLETESQPIGVTALHPIWSVDRNAWVSAMELDEGERVKTLAGTTVVESLSIRDEVEPVFNIEVDGDHVYRVGESGVLVHNVSQYTFTCPFPVDDDECPVIPDTDHCASFSPVTSAPGGGTWTAYVNDVCGKTCPEPNMPSPHGHHVVQKGTTNPYLQAARQILCKYGINPWTDCRNLACSPNRCHSSDYAKCAYAGLKEASSVSQVESALEQLAQAHRECE